MTFGRWALIDLAAFVDLLDGFHVRKLIVSIAASVVSTKKSALHTRQSCGAEIIAASDTTIRGISC